MEKGKRQREKCDHETFFPTMHGLYMKKHGTWKRVGWICLTCFSVIIDYPRRYRSAKKPQLTLKGEASKIRAKG